jgi:hypothetical protein
MGFYKQVFGGAWMTQALGVAAELGVADHLAAGPLTAQELAQRTGAHADSLYRVLRALASAGVFEHDADERFGLTPLSELLRSDVPGSQRCFAAMMGGEFHAAWGELLHSARTGEPGFDKRFGKSFFEYMTERPDRHAIYDRAMEGVHGRETDPVLDAYDFSFFGTVADIGGGNGSALAATLRRHSGMQGILFDLPSVADRTRAGVAASDVAARLCIEGGDFFTAVPSGADAYVLRHVIHDWMDDDAVAILRSCRKAMKPASRILVVEMVIPSDGRPGFGKWLDLMMLLVRGRERTAAEYGRLFAAAGLKLERVIATASDASIVEGVPA